LVAGVDAREEEAGSEATVGRGLPLQSADDPPTRHHSLRADGDWRLATHPFFDGLIYLEEKDASPDDLRREKRCYEQIEKFCAFYKICYHDAGRNL
jgi:hypothetical protein